MSSKHLKKLAKIINIKDGDSIIDVACGIGTWANVCTNLGAKVSGIDISEKATQKCKELFPKGVFHTCPAETLPFENKEFDFVSCLGSLEHFINPKKALEEMVRVAGDNARFIILVPNSGFLTRKLNFFSGTQQVDAKEHVRSLTEWEELFESAGLKITKKWKDLHVLSWTWIKSDHWYKIPARFLQALMLVFWPLKWQYQVYHLCIKI